MMLGSNYAPLPEEPTTVLRPDRVLVTAHVVMQVLDERSRELSRWVGEVKVGATLRWGSALPANQRDEPGVTRLVLDQAHFPPSFGVSASLLSVTVYESGAQLKVRLRPPGERTFSALINRSEPKPAETDFGAAVVDFREAGMAEAELRHIESRRVLYLRVWPKDTTLPAIPRGGTIPVVQESRAELATRVHDEWLTFQTRKPWFEAYRVAATILRHSPDVIDDDASRETVFRILKPRIAGRPLDWLRSGANWLYANNDIAWHSALARLDLDDLFLVDGYRGATCAHATAKATQHELLQLVVRLRRAGVIRDAELLPDHPRWHVGVGVGVGDGR